MKKLQKWSLGIIGFCVLLIIFISILPKTEEQKAAKRQEAKKLINIEQKIKAISDNESVGKFILVSKIEDNGSIYKIQISLLFEPEDYQQVQTWTDAVCESAKYILDNNGISRNISIWAQRSDPKQGGNVILYGRTFYSAHTDKSEFKNIKELNL